MEKQSAHFISLQEWKLRRGRKDYKFKGLRDQDDDGVIGNNADFWEKLTLTTEKMKGSIFDMLTWRLRLAKWRYGTDNERYGAGEPFVFRQILPRPLQGPHNLIPTWHCKPVLDGRRGIRVLTLPRKTAKSKLLILGISKSPCHWNINFKQWVAFKYISQHFHFKPI